jgi:hypothetical protein
MCSTIERQGKEVPHPGQPSNAQAIEGCFPQSVLPAASSHAAQSNIAAIWRFRSMGQWTLERFRETTFKTSENTPLENTLIPKMPRFSANHCTGHEFIVFPQWDNQGNLKIALNRK